MFPNRVISRFLQSVCEYFLWEYLQSKVYANRSQIVQELKSNIRAEIEAIPNEMLQGVTHNFINQLEQCQEQIKF